MNKKVIFLDIDGTLVDETGKAPASAQKALQKARENGHKLVLCTGRSKFQIPKELLALGIDGIISGAGAYVEAREQSKEAEKEQITILLQTVIEEAYAKSTYEYLEGNGFLFCYQAEDGIVLNQRSFEGMNRVDRKSGISDEMMANLHGNVHLQDEPWKFPNLEKIIFYEAPFALEKIKQDLMPYFDTVTLSLSGSKGVAGEIGRSNIHKATGMKLYLEHVGAKREDAVAIGDGPNDLQMLEYAGIGVAMGNAKEEIKAAADIITASVKEDGIYQAFQQIGLLEQEA